MGTHTFNLIFDFWGNFRLLFSQFFRRLLLTSSIVFGFSFSTSSLSQPHRFPTGLGSGLLGCQSRRLITLDSNHPFATGREWSGKLSCWNDHRHSNPCPFYCNASLVSEYREVSWGSHHRAQGKFSQLTKKQPRH